MKSVTFQNAVHDALSHIPKKDKSIFFISIGSHLTGKRLTPSRLSNQQFPLQLHKTKNRVFLFLIDPRFNTQDPPLLDHLENGYIIENHTLSKAIPLDDPHVTIYKIGHFFQDEAFLIHLLHEHPHIQFYIGDFTITGPFSPFENFPQLHQAIRGRGNVKVATDEKLEHYQSLPIQLA